MNTIAEIIGYITTAIAIGMYFPQTYKVWKTKDTSSLSKPTFIAICFGCLFWAFWAVLKLNMNPVWMTYVGVALLMIPIIHYLFKDNKAVSITLNVSIFFTAVFAIVYTVMPGTVTLNETASLVLIIIGSCLSSYCWIPQAMQVYKTKKADSLSSITLSLIIFNQSLTLIYYGLKISDSPSDVTLYISVASFIISTSLVIFISMIKLLGKKTKSA